MEYRGKDYEVKSLADALEEFEQWEKEGKHPCMHEAGKGFFIAPALTIEEALEAGIYVSKEAQIAYFEGQRARNNRGKSKVLAGKQRQNRKATNA